MGDSDQLPLEPPARRRRRRRGRVSVEVLPSGSIRVRARGTCADGRPYDESRHIPVEIGDERARRAEADRVKAFLLKRVVDLESGAAILEESLTLSEWLARGRRSGMIAPLSRPEESTWKGPCRPLWNLPLQAFDDARLNGWLERLRSKFSPSYIRSAWNLVRRLLRLAKGARLIAVLPFHKPSIPSDAETQTRRAVSPSQAAAVLEAARTLDAEGQTDGSLALRLWFAAQTGCRPIECAWAEARHLRIDAEAGAVVFVRAAKGSADHEIPIPVELYEALHDHFHALPAAARSRGLIFPFRASRARWRPRWVEKKRKGKTDRVARYWVPDGEIKALRARSGLPDFDCYQLRHFRFERAAEILTDKQLQRFTGHKSPRMLGRYIQTTTMDLPAESGGSVVPMPKAARPALLVLEGGASARGRADSASNEGDRGDARSPVGASMGGYRHGRTVGTQAFDVGRVEQCRAIVQAASDTGWESWAAWQASQVGADAAIDAADEIETIGRSGLLGGDGSWEATAVGVATALRTAAGAVARSAPTSKIIPPKKAPMSGRKLRDSAMLGGGAGSRCTVIETGEREEGETQLKDSES